MKGESRKVEGREVRYLRIGRGRPLFFFQGFGVSPKYYRPLLKRLGEKFEVIAPDVLRPRAMRGQPETMAGLADLLEAFCAGFDAGPCDLVGHSMGGAMAYTLGDRSADVRRIVGINPLLPVTFGTGAYVWRSFRKGGRESIGQTGGFKAVWFANRFHPPFVINTLMGMRWSLRLIGDARGFRYDQLSVAQPALLLFGEEDEYFGLDHVQQADLRAGLSDLTIERLVKRNHDWLLFYPDEAAASIERFLLQPLTSERSP